MKRLFSALPALVLVLACTPPKPPIFVITNPSGAALEGVKTGRFKLKPIGAVDLHDFKRAFVKRYESEEAFLRGFQTDLETKVNADAPAEATPFTLELPKLDVGSHTVGYWVSTGGGPHMPPQQHYVSNEYCDIRLTYRVIDPSGAAVLEGTVVESTDKGEFLHSNQTKLANAIAGVQQHLVDYLRGRMAIEHIAPPKPEEPAK
jgi:hypothetical protein